MPHSIFSIKLSRYIDNNKKQLKKYSANLVMAETLKAATRQK